MSITTFFKPVPSPSKKRKAADAGLDEDEEGGKNAAVAAAAQQDGEEKGEQKNATVLTPEQRARIAEKKAEAEKKLAAKRGPSSKRARVEAKAAAAAEGEGEGEAAEGESEEKKKKAAGEFYSGLQELMHESWREKLAKEFDKPYFVNIESKLNGDVEKKRIFPPRELIFNAFNKCPFDKVRVVILGQDPYHAPGQAMGLSFSVPEGVAIPSSLRNIYKELKEDISGFTPPKHGNLEKWAEQGVLLLNTTLTVQMSNANSHSKYGWEAFTDAVIDLLNKQGNHIVFMLWGAHAQKKAKKINESKHLVLKAAHPSGLSAHKGFWGCKHFSKCNAFLSKHNPPPIDWKL